MNLQELINNSIKFLQVRRVNASAEELRLIMVQLASAEANRTRVRALRHAYNANELSIRFKTQQADRIKEIASEIDQATAPGISTTVILNLYLEAFQILTEVL